MGDYTGNTASVGSCILAIRCGIRARVAAVVSVFKGPADAGHTFGLERRRCRRKPSETARSLISPGCLVDCTMS